MKWLALILSCATLSACATPPNIIAPSKQDNQPLTRFAHCASFGCGYTFFLYFTPAEWTEIGSYFQGTTDAADERVRITRVMSRYEQIVGPKDATQGDVGGSGLALDLGQGQLDCYAEAANTTVALQMMQKSGFLKFHTVSEPGMRGLPYGTLSLEHATATIIDRATGVRYAVDTWFFDNGGPSFVVEFNEWRHGWHPKGGAGI